MLHPLKMWVEYSVREADDRASKKQTPKARDKRKGIAQGSAISALLANLSMRRAAPDWKMPGWKMPGLEQLGSRIVTSADDLLILCRNGKIKEALQQPREIISPLKFTVDAERTRICTIPQGDFDFWDHSLGRLHSARAGQAQLGYRPSKKTIKRMVEKAHALTDRTGTWRETAKPVEKLNRTLWTKFFTIDTVNKVYRAIANHSAMRSRRWPRTKHKVGPCKDGTDPRSHLHKYFRPIRPTALGRDVSRMKA